MPDTVTVPRLDKGAVQQADDYGHRLDKGAVEAHVTATTPPVFRPEWAAGVNTHIGLGV